MAGIQIGSGKWGCLEDIICIILVLGNILKVITQITTSLLIQSPGSSTLHLSVFVYKIEYFKEFMSKNVVNE